MSSIPALQRMGADLEAALSRRPRPAWWRAHPLLAVLAATAVVAVPAAGSQVEWAGLVNGETALPTQASPGVRTVLSSGDRYRSNAWQLVVYKARIGNAASDGPVGLCAYVTLSIQSSGSGRCTRDTAMTSLLVVSGGDTTGVVAGLVDGRATRVELTLGDGRRLAVAPQMPAPALLRDRGLPAGLRFFAADFAEPNARGAPSLAGTLVRDGTGAELARSGRPEAVPSSAPLLRSPVSIEPKEGP